VSTSKTSFFFDYAKWAILREFRFAKSSNFCEAEGMFRKETSFSESEISRRLFETTETVSWLKFYAFPPTASKSLNVRLAAKLPAAYDQCHGRRVEGYLCDVVG